MQVASTAKLFRVTKLLRSSLRNLDNSLSSLQYSAHIRQMDVTMTNIFKGRGDHYNGITVDSAEEYCDNKIFAVRLKGTLSVLLCFCFSHLQIKIWLIKH